MRPSFPNSVGNFVINFLIIAFTVMESLAQGWQALSNISTFMQHVEKRRQLKVFGELDARLDFCEYLIRKQSNKNDIKRFKSKKRKKQLNQDLVNAVESLSFDQIIHYFNKLVAQLVDLTRNILSPPVIQSKSFIICQAYSRTYSLKMWKKKKLRFDRENHIIYAEKDKKIKIYDLANYLVRRTQKGDYFCLALQAVNNVPLQRSKSALFGFQYKNTYLLWLSSIQKSVQYKQWESLVFSLNKEQLMVKKRVEQQTKVKEKEKQWERLNKTQGNCNENQQKPMQAAQSAIYIPLHSPNEEINLTADAAIKNRHSHSPPQSENILTSSFKVEPQIDFHTIIKQSFAYRLTHLSNAFQSIEDLQFQLQIQDESVKKNKMQLSFASALLDQIDINSTFFEYYNDYEKIDSTFFHNKTQTNKFKLQYLVQSKQNISIKTVVSHFLNLDRYKQMNKSISNCSTKTIIFSQNCTLNHQQHHPYNRLYRPRQFYYIRHLTKNIQNQYVIIDRSIKSQALPLPENSFYVRGELNAIYRFINHQNGIKILIDISLNNGGGLAQVQNITLSKKYVNDLARGLSLYFSQSIKQCNIPKYFNFETHSRYLNKLDQTSSNASIILNYQTQAQVLPLLETPKSKTKAKGSFYRIPRNQIIQNTSLTQSFFIDQEPQLRLRKTLSPSRKTYIQNRNSKKISQQNTTEQQGEWQACLEPTWKQDWIIDETKGGVIMKRNPGVRQRQVMKKIIETAVKKSLLGKDMQSISFPVDILAPESHLQRLMGHLRSAPSLFTGITQLSLMQKFMKIVVFGLQISLLSLHNERAFDALLGETLQCKIGEECNGYAEQLSISPNIAAISLIGKEFQLSAVLRQRFKMTMNSATWKNDGIYRVKIQDEQFCFTTPSVTLNGTTYNQRQFLLQQRAYYWIQSKNIVLQLNFQPKNSFSLIEDAKRDYFDGTIYEVSPSFMKQFANNKQTPKQQHISRIICKVSGRYTKNITFQNQTIDISHLPLSQIYLHSYPLPSDSSLREDINKLREGELEQAQNLKQFLQESQSRDGILRSRSFSS